MFPLVKRLFGRGRQEFTSKVGLIVSVRDINANRVMSGVSVARRLFYPLLNGTTRAESRGVKAAFLGVFAGFRGEKPEDGMSVCVWPERDGRLRQGEEGS